MKNFYKVNLFTKRVKHNFLFIVIILLSVFSIQKVNAQLTFTNPNITPAYAVTDVLLGTGVTATNITFNGSPVNANTAHPSVLEFSNTSAIFPLSDGILMQTDNGVNISDPDLTAITTNTVTNGAIIEFDFVPDGDSLSFSYIFASREYNSFTCSNYNDVFGFFISGPGITGPYTNNAKNIATIPNSNNIPVGINTVNAGTNSDFNNNCFNANPNWVADAIYFTTSYNGVYTSNNSVPNFNGSTVELTANASVICGQTYHIKLAISNVMDTGFDSGVFLKGGSFSSSPNVEVSSENITSGYLDSVVVEGCDQGTFCFERPAAQSIDTAVIYYTMGGTAIENVDYDYVNQPNPGDSIIFLPGDSIVCLTIDPVDDGIHEGLKNILLSAYTVNSCGDTTYSYSEMFIADKPEDLVPDAGNDTVVCSSGLGTLNGSATMPNNDVEWSYNGPGNVTFTPDIFDLNADVAFDTPGIYTMYLTESNDSCSLQAIDSMTVIFEDPSLTVSNDTTICENGTANLIANATGGNNFDYHWSHTADLSGNQQVQPSVLTEYIVTAETDNGCLTPPDTIVVDANPPITLNSSPSQTICPGESIDVVANVSGGDGGPYNYEWTTPNGTVVGNSDMINVSPLVTTDYTIEVSDNCESTVQTSISEVVVAELPNLQFDVVDGELCTPAEFVLINQSDSSLVEETYWYISDGQTFVQNDSVDVLIKGAGSYNVGMTVVTPDGCVDSAKVNGLLTVYPKPESNFSYYPKPATILNPEVRFQNSSLDAVSYEWIFEQGDPAFSSLEDPTTNFPNGETGSYLVELIAISEFECRDTSEQIVSVIPEVLIFVPNTFTPDGDENNPTWKPIIDGIDKTNVTIEIFNRWGEKVWESHDLNVGWDGTYGTGNRMVKEGAYIWKIKATNFINDEKYVWDGVVNVLY